LNATLDGINGGQCLKKMPRACAEKRITDAASTRLAQNHDRSPSVLDKLVVAIHGIGPNVGCGAIRAAPSSASPKEHNSEADPTNGFMHRGRLLVLGCSSPDGRHHFSQRGLVSHRPAGQQQ
jgi:hypothetical protein